MQRPRPTFHEIYMSLALMLSDRSTCHRAKVGCVITTDDFTQVLSLGYNGGARGHVHGCVSPEPGKCGCAHAEMNAIAKLDYNNPFKKKAFCTTEPCRLCAVLLINAGISEVIYLNEYRLHEGLDLLGEVGIKVWRFSKDDLFIPNSLQRAVGGKKDEENG